MYTITDKYLYINMISEKMEGREKLKVTLKKAISVLLAVVMVFTSVNIVPSTVEAAVNSSSGSSSWSLVWNDEFNQTVGEAPDSSTWSYDIGHGDNGWGNQELQRYTNSTDNVRIVDMSSDSGSTDGKALAITAKRENGEITSGRIKTLNKQYLKYGRVEARLRLDDGMRSGVWPAFWMMGNDIESGAPWPYCGEIDIMEHRNAEKQIISTLHWNTGTGTSANNAHIYSGSETTNQYGNIDSINDWHNYAVEWYEDVVKFYLDGVCFETLNINNSEMEEFQKEHFILLNLAIGSSGSPFTKGETVSDDFQSATMYVDYVRVYQGKDSAFSIAKSGTSETKPTPTTTGDGSVEETTTTTTKETTQVSDNSLWQEIGGGDANTWYYDKNSMSGISGVVNIQQPGFAKEMGIYITVPSGISSVSVNGNTEGVAAIQGAGAVVYLSALTKQTNTVTINYAGGTGTVIIKNTNGTSDGTTTETQTESQTPTETINAADPYADVETVLTAPTNAYLYNFTQEGNGYKLSFTKADNSSILGEKTGTEKYALYVNDMLIKEINATELTVNASNNTATVSLAEGDVSKSGLTKGQQQKVSVREIYSVSDSENYYSPKSATTTFMYGNVESPYADDVPQIFISSSRLADGSGKKNDNVDLLTDTSKTKVNAAIVVKDEKGNNTSYSNIGNIKVRGNSTALTEKKPYNISFNEATDLFGMGKAKKWSLLANAFDKSLIRNKLAMDFQRTLESTYTPNNVYTSNCKFVDLYVDGTFLGNYLLIESVETGSSRVDINDGYVDDTDNAKTESEPAKVTINGTEYSVYDALLELANDVTETDSRYDEGTYYFKTNGCSEIFSINAPERSNTSYGYKESDTNKPEWVTNINTYLNGFETVLNQPATTDEEQKAQFDLISQFIDVDSFVNFYITEEYFMCKDVNFSSTRFYTKGGKLYAGPLWDLDLSSGNIVDHNGYEDYYAQHFAWFNKLMTNKYFKEKVINRFTDVQPIIKQIYAENGTMDTEINSAKKSIDRNYLAKSEGGAGWELNRRYTGDNYSNNVNKMYTEYASYISDLRTWLQGRNTWLSATTQWNVTDDEYTWISIPNSNYYYFVPEGNQYKVTNANVASEKILLAYGTQGFNATKVTVDGTEISSDNYESTGSVEFKIKESVLAKNGHPYKVAVYTENSGDTPYFTVYLKKTAPEDYVPKGFAVAVDNSGLLTATWTTTSDANAAAATYEVKVGTEIAKVTGSTATYQLSSYGKYKVTLTTMIGSEIKDTQTLELTYSDPDTVGGTLTVSENWEAERAESLVWTEVKNATGYGIYVDGKLYKTTNNTEEKVPAYVFAEKSENTNKLSKPTTVGNHTTTVLALFEDEKAPELLTDGKSKNIVGEPYDTTLYVNYIFGTGTNLWNKSISDNVWNFTVCEAIDKKGVTKGALADVEYNDDGSATVKFNDMGENTQSDSSGNRQQPWNVKGALYNIPTENDKEVTVSFDIIGPACLAEKKSGYPGEPEGEEKTQGITINFTPEEIVNGAYGAAYKYAKYYFEPATVNGKQVSVLHYSENVKTTNTSYDLLFGLGDLVFSGDDKTLTLTNPVTSTVYGVDTVDAKGLYTSDGKGAAYVGFTSTVPNRQEPYYTYKVSVLDGETTLEEQVVDNPSHITLKNGETGYVPGKEYTVKVESIYAITNEVTATKTATVTIPNEAEKKADLVISSVINKRTNSTTVADSVFRTGESVDVKVTVSNIGSVTSETTKLGLYNASLENTPLLDEKDVPAIEPGQSVTLTFTNTLASEPNEYHFLLKVNADKTTSESDYTNNNSNTEIKAYAPITDDLKITDSETAHRISWESVDGATSYEIRYSKKDGTEARAIVSGTTEYQLTEIPKEGTEIQLWAVESDNTKYEVKYTVPKADMIISALKMVSEPLVDQYYRVGDTIKYEVTMKNIGLGKAVAKDGKITIHLVAGKNNNTESMIEKAYAVSANGNDINNISSGDSVTVTMETVLSDSDLGEIYFGGRADADGDIDEGNENNNYSIISTPVIVKEKLADSIVFANDGTNVTATWPAYNDATGYKIRYITGITNSIVGETVIKATEGTTYSFSDNNSYPDSGKSVYVYAVMKDGTEQAVYASTAYADLIVTNIGLTNGNSIIMGTTDSVTGTVKNVGVARAVAFVGSAQWCLLMAKTGTASPYNYSEEILLPNATTDITINEAYKAPDTAGEYSIDYEVNEGSRIPESEEGKKNNTGTFKVNVGNKPSAVSNLKNTEGTTFTWDESEGATSYKIYVDNALVDTVDKPTITIPTDKLSTIGEHTVKVVASNAFGDAQGTEIIKIISVEEKPLTELVQKEQWEYARNEVLSWAKDNEATGYAIYINGELYTTLDQTSKVNVSCTVPAYAFAEYNKKHNILNRQNQPTTVGTFNVSVVTLTNNTTAPETLTETEGVYSTDVENATVVGTKKTVLGVNYVYGSGTKLWLGDNPDNAWNFTICEGSEVGADVKVDYTSDGLSILTFHDMGNMWSTEAKNAFRALTTAEQRIEALNKDGKDDIDVGDQQWTVKAAIYDGNVNKGENLNLSFDIVGPANITGQVISIKCVPEEYDINNNNYFDVGITGYEEKFYKFEGVDKDEDGVDDYSVLHYTNSFVATSDSYDLLFGLGLLDLTSGEKLTFTDPKVTEVYGVTKATASADYSKKYDSNYAISMLIESDVPSHLEEYYTYKVVVKDSQSNVVSTEIVDNPGNISLTNNNKGYPLGEYTVEVESIYNEKTTSSRKTTVTLANQTGPDMIISKISLSPSTRSDGTYRVGDTVTVSFTMKNIGNEQAVPTGNLCAYTYVDGVYKEWKRGSAEPMAIGEEYNDSFTVKLDEQKKYVFSVKADAEEKVSELNEDNNTLSTSIYVYDAEKTLDLKNDGSKVYAQWPKAEQGLTGDYIISYVSGGKTYEENVKNATSYEFKEGKYPDYNSTVTLKVAKDDGTLLNVAVATAKPDMVISSISVPKRHYTVGETVKITSVMKNIGTSNAQLSGGDSILQKWVLGGTYTTDGKGGQLRDWSTEGITEFNINQELSYTFNYVITENDVKDGKILISTYADADFKLLEIDENNNSSDVIELVVGEPTQLTLKQQNVDVSKAQYGNGKVEAVWPAATDATAYEIVYNTGATYKPVQETSVTRTKVLRLENPVETESSIKYTSDGNTFVYNKNDKTFTYVFEESLDNKSKVTVRNTYEENVGNETVYYDYASATAYADLIVTDLDVTGDRVTTQNGKKVIPVKLPFNLTMNVRNIGTAAIGSAGEDFETYYGGWNMTSLIEQTNVPGIVGNENLTAGGINTAYCKGIVAGQSVPVTISKAIIKSKGDYTLKVKTDSPGFAEAEDTGYFDESDETNNYATIDVSADYNQQKMDWVPIHYSESDELVQNGTVSVNDNYPFKIAATQSTIEYKVLNSSIPDLDYSDIVTRYVGYANTHISIGFNNEYSIVSTKPYQYKEVGEGKGNYVKITDANGNVTYKEVENNKGDYIVESVISDTVTQYSQVNGDYANNYGTSSFVPNFNVLQNQGCYINNWLNNGEVLAPTSNTQIGYVGNGFNFNAESWGLGKYYVMKLKTGPDENADWVEMAFRVKTDGSQWIKVNATDGTDADKLPFYYHDDTYETKGTFFYDCSDMNLSSITSYNGDHLAVQLDNSTVPDLTKLNWRVAITTASVDDKGNFKIPTKSDEDYEVQIQSSTDGIVGVQGTGRLLMKLPEIMEQLPVHSDNGGTRDSNYYYMKIFYDTTDTSNPYVAIPIKVEADIPKIEEIHGMTVAKRGDNLSVQWTNTTTQDEHGYTYDIYIRDVKNNGEFVKVTDTPVVAGNYNFKDYDLQTIGNEYEVKVVGKWGGHCQSTEKTLSYKVVAPEENRDYITDETFNYDSLSNDKWMPISGEHNLPVHLENTVSATVNADIYYYTDKDLDNAIGYNGSYISLVGNEKYFTGSTSSLYVKNGNTYKYESRNIYDNFYKGQILMNVAELFTTYGDYTDVSELYDRAMYYTVRVYGNNGANYKDYYFKIVPKPDGSTVEQSSGKWREISGEHKLPVTFSDLKLDGDVYFYDYKSKTNTYDIRGYNGEYMALLGKKENYRAGTTTVQISKPISMNMASDFDRKTGTNSYDTDKYIEKAKAGTLHEIYGNATYTSDDSIFESKNIYESVYDGFINVKASDVVSVSYGTNFYILKITNGDNVAYVPMKVVVKSGDVEVQGFQINYDKGAGSASEFNPATRIVSRACKVMTVGDTLHRVKEHGTIFGVADYIKSSDMTLDSTSNYVSHMATTAKGLYNGYVSGLNDDDTYNYYGFTIKWNTYNYSALTTKYSYRAYAKLDNNQVVYGHKIYTANTYEVAENLYNNSKMPNVQAHDFLYDNILNIVDMGTNRKYISYAMVKALNVRKTTDPKYTLINTVFQDIYDYVRCSDKAYTYQDRKPFECKDANVESELLGYLNNASKELHGSDFAEYKSLADWIYGETGNYGQSSMPSYPGCYKKADFGWGSNIFTDYDSE